MDILVVLPKFYRIDRTCLLAEPAEYTPQRIYLISCRIAGTTLRFINFKGYTAGRTDGDTQATGHAQCFSRRILLKVM